MRSLFWLQVKTSQGKETLNSTLVWKEMDSVELSRSRHTNDYSTASFTTRMGYAPRDEFCIGLCSVFIMKNKFALNILKEHYPGIKYSWIRSYIKNEMLPVEGGILIIYNIFCIICRCARYCISVSVYGCLYSVWVCFNCF